MNPMIPAAAVAAARLAPAAARAECGQQPDQGGQEVDIAGQIGAGTRRAR